MLGVDGENGFPSRGSGVHVAKTVVVGGNLETSGEVMAIASDSSFEVRERVVNHVEMHVIQAALVPSRSMVG